MFRTSGFIIPASFPDESAIKAKLSELAEASGFTPYDENEILHSVDLNDDALAHFGTKGMKWGVRKVGDIPAKTNRAAKKDAEEFARAKMFYGESAGTRRKLIKATVESRSNRDPAYKKAFESHLANQNMSKHASKAQSERKRKDVKNSAAKTTRGITHLIKGNPQYASAAATLLFGGATYAHKAGVDKIIVDDGKKKYSDIQNARQSKTLADLLKNLGVNPE